MLMPGKPKVTESQTEGKDGAILRTTYLVSHADTAYMLSVTENPVHGLSKNKQEVLEAARDSAAKALKGENVKSRPFPLGETTGLDYSFNLPDDKTGNGGSCRSRIFLVDRRLYQIITVTPTGKDDAASVQKYLDSFRLTAR